MRKGFWVVLGLVGTVPMGALAQQQAQPQPPAGQASASASEEVSNAVLQQQIEELWQGFRMLQQEIAALREQTVGRPAAPAVGGAGSAGTGAAAGGGSGQAGTGAVAGSPDGAEAEDSGLIIVELPAQGGQGMAGGAEQRAPRAADRGTGGSGQGQGARAQARTQASEDAILGTVKSFSDGELLLVDPAGRVFGFRVGEQTRIIGQGGGAAALRGLQEGTAVRVVPLESGTPPTLRSLHILQPPSAPRQ